MLQAIHIEIAIIVEGKNVGLTSTCTMIFFTETIAKDNNLIYRKKSCRVMK